METPNPSPAETAPKTIARQAATNEWGQITGLEANAPYFIIRKPTPEYTRAMSKDVMEQARAFLHEHRVLTEQQMKELNEKYGEPAKARVNELRSTLEKRFDEIAKEIETRVETLEGELQTRGILKGKKAEAAPSGAPGETPGEMPSGANGASSAPATKKRAPRTE